MKRRQVYGSATGIRLLELIQHAAPFRQHRLHELLLRLIAQTFADHLVQHLPGLCQQLQRFAFNQISHPAMPTGEVSVAPIADERFVWVAGWTEASKVAWVERSSGQQCE